MMRRPLRRAAVAFLVAAAACSDAPPPTGPDDDDPCPSDLGSGVSRDDVPGLRVWTLEPRSTNTCLTLAPDPHVVAVAAAGASAGRLFLFLPGSGARPENYRRIVREAAAAGYHAVGLAYVNDLPVAVRCAFAASDCYGRVRLEVITGTDASPAVEVSRGESVEGRLVRLLQAMAELDADGGWLDYVDGGVPRWDRISVAGHSQGGGNALFIAQRTEVFRATAYSSGGDLLPQSGAPAPWVADPWITPAARRFGFSSEADELLAWNDVRTAWTAAGLSAFGPPFSVDGTAPPFAGSHMLSTAAPPRNPGLVVAPNHSVTVVDVVTPLTGGGEPLFAPVWRALSFPPP